MRFKSNKRNRRNNDPEKKKRERVDCLDKNQ